MITRISAWGHRLSRPRVARLVASSEVEYLHYPRPQLESEASGLEGRRLKLARPIKAIGSLIPSLVELWM